MRNVLSLIAIAAVSITTPLFAQTGNPVAGVGPPVSSDEYMGIDTYRLWEGRAELAQGDGPDETPSISLFRLTPVPGNGLGNGTAIIVAPGGGYMGRAVALEGRQVADWFAARGVTAFVLNYRTGVKSLLPAPIVDGRRAVQFVRAHAAKLGVDPKRIGMIGFSAGGHLAAMNAVTPAEGKPDAEDLLDRVSSRPDFLVLAYPWLEATDATATGGLKYCQMIEWFSGGSIPSTGSSQSKSGKCDPSRFAQYQPTPLVTEQTPPTFIYQTTTDTITPVHGSLRLFEALTANKVPVEMHVFEKGEHGSGLGGSDPALGRWPELLEAWMRARKLFEPVGAEQSKVPSDQTKTP